MGLSMSKKEGFMEGRGGDKARGEKKMISFDSGPRIAKRGIVLAAACGRTKWVSSDSFGNMKMVGSCIPNQGFRQEGIERELILAYTLIFSLVKSFTMEVLERREENEVLERTDHKGIIFVPSRLFNLIKSFVLGIFGEEQRKRKAKGKDLVSLPDDLQLRILSEFNMHTLLNLSRVSKTWRSWISTEYHVIGKCPMRTDGFFYRGPKGFVYTLLPDSSSYKEGDLCSRKPPGKKDYFPNPVSEDGNGLVIRFTHARHSWNGLILLSSFQNELLYLLVHNPTTRQSILLPPSGCRQSSPLWVGSHYSQEGYFHVVYATDTQATRFLVLNIFSSKTWTWRSLITNVHALFPTRRHQVRAVTRGKHMFLDLTLSHTGLVVLDPEAENYHIVPFPPHVYPYINASTALGISLGNIMFAYHSGSVLEIYQLLDPLEQGGEYRWVQLIKDKSISDRMARRLGNSFGNMKLQPQDFLLHVTVLVLSAICPGTKICKTFYYDFSHGSILPLLSPGFNTFKLNPFSVCPLRIRYGA